MSIDWEKLGLREPENLAALWMWRWQVPYKLLGFIPFGKADVVLYGPTQHDPLWSVLHDDRNWDDFSGIESAAAHLIRLGCGRAA